MARKTISDNGAQKLLVTIYPDDAERLEEMRRTMAQELGRHVAYAEVIRTIISNAHKEMKDDE
jgi:hypothetical protein